MQHLDQLIHATNQVLSSERVTPEKLQEIFTIGCKTLTMLSDDDEFFADLKLVNANESLRDDIKNTFDNLNRFEQFLEMERKAFHEAGISCDTEKFLTQQAREVRQLLPKWHNDPEAIRIGINKLRNETCNTAGILKDLNPARERFRNIRSLARRIAFGISGATVLGMNAKATVSMGQVYALASVQFGNKLIGKAFD